MPRLNSLLHRLLRTRSPGGEPRLDQLMSFIDHPPSGTRDRWKAGAAMCAAWGISTTGASVWRLHQSFLARGQARLAAAELSTRTSHSVHSPATPTTPAMLLL